MLPLLLGLVTLLNPESRLQKTVLPNGATVIVVTDRASSNLHVELFVGMRGITKAQKPGLRHLLEHLWVAGSDGSLDDRLESKSAFLRAQTLRDAMVFSVDALPSDLPLVRDAFKEILAVKSFSGRNIATEKRTITREGEILGDSARLSASAWTAAYGGDGEDPQGDPSEMAVATPSEIAALKDALVRPSNLALVVSGPINFKMVDQVGEELFAQLPRESTLSSPPVRQLVALPSTYAKADAFGEARGVPVPDVSDSRCMATLAAALAVASDLDGAFVTYSPSSRPGMVVLGDTVQHGRLSSALDSLSAEGIQRYARIGRILIRGWLGGLTSSPEAEAHLRGLLKVQADGLGLEVLENRVNGLTVDEISAAVTLLQAPRAISVVGNQ